MKKKLSFIFVIALIFVIGVFDNVYAIENTDNKKTITINDTSLNFKNIIYVDNNGNDENADGSKEKPFKNVDTAIKNAESEDAIFIKAGKYKLTPININTNISACIFDNWKNITFIGEGKDTVLEYHGEESTSRGGQLLCLANKNSKVIGISFNFYPGKTSSYDNAIFVACSGSFHNIYIQTLGENASSFTYSNDGVNDEPKIYNSVFNLNLQPSSNYSGMPKFINCISNYFIDNNKDNCMSETVEFEKVENLKTDNKFLDKGVGVYTGEFHWGEVNINENLDIKTKSINFDKTSMDLLEGNSEKITATVLPENATNKKLIWSSSDENIATVDEEGNVKSIKEGQATITAKVENTDLTATCKVNVTKPVEEKNSNAILSISLVNGAIKEYDVPMEEVDKFIKWFEDRSNGNGSSLYAFNKNISPYKSVKEYIAQDKIVSFEVKEY